MFTFVRTRTLLMETVIQYRCEQCPTYLTGERHNLQWPIDDKAAFDCSEWRKKLWDGLKATPNLCDRCMAREEAQKKRAANVEWVLPVKMNDWGKDYFYAVFDRVECLSNMGTFSSSGCRFPCIMAGYQYDIKWPDGSISVATIVDGPSRSVTINDMGHDYHASTSDLFVERDVNGAKSLISLIGSGVMLRPAKAYET